MGNCSVGRCRLWTSFFRSLEQPKSKIGVQCSNDHSINELDSALQLSGQCEPIELYCCAVLPAFEGILPSGVSSK